MNPLTIGTDLIDGLLMLGLLGIAVSAFIMSRKASENWDDDSIAKY